MNSIPNPQRMILLNHTAILSGLPCSLVDRTLVFRGKCISGSFLLTGFKNIKKQYADDREVYHTVTGIGGDRTGTGSAANEFPVQVSSQRTNSRTYDR